MLKKVKHRLKGLIFKKVYYLNYGSPFVELEDNDIISGIRWAQIIGMDSHLVDGTYVHKVISVISSAESVLLYT